MPQTKRIILLLDESGSMGSQKYEVIKGVNDMISHQRKLQKDAMELSIIKFNTKVNKIKTDSLYSFSPFTNQDYYPSGGTALYDAIGKTINRFIHEVNTIMVILTDGLENSSKQFTRSQMTNLINKQRTTKNWNFIYLSEDPTTFEQGEVLGISNSAYNCSNMLVGNKNSGKTIGSMRLQNYISDVSQGKTTQNYNDWNNFQQQNSNFESCW